jgi:hypothetical protein
VADRDDSPKFETMFDDTNIIIWSTLLAMFFIVAVYLIHPKLCDPYGMFHIELNASGSSKDQHERTEWLNMGYWRVSPVMLFI